MKKDITGAKKSEQEKTAKGARVGRGFEEQGDIPSPFFFLRVLKFEPLATIFQLHVYLNAWNRLNQPKPPLFIVDRAVDTRPWEKGRGQSQKNFFLSKNKGWGGGGGIRHCP